MYLFYAMPGNYIPMGNDGQMKVPASIRSNKALIKLAESWLGKRPGRVYLMHEWTQKMCELGPRAFEEYVMRNGTVVAHS